MTTKVTLAISRPDEKKLEMNWKIEIELSINCNTKSPEIERALSLKGTFSKTKYVCVLTYQISSF